VLWLVHGRKHWYVYPPGAATEEDLLAAQGLSAWAWAAGRAAGEGAAGAGTGAAAKAAKAGGRQCTQRAGEVCAAAAAASLLRALEI
jgi:hypothetical protein